MKPGKIELGNGITPFHPTPRLANFLGVNLWLKRDDMNGFALGGNKIRKLEYIMQDALMQKADTIVAAGGPQSNHMRLTAAAAVHLGMKSVMVYYGHSPDTKEGNYLLTQLLGVESVFTGSLDRASVDREASLVIARLKQEGHKPYFVPRGGATPLGTLGYVEFVKELKMQIDESNIVFEHLIVTCGSGGTLAGICLGAEVYGLGLKIWGINVSRPREESMLRVKELADRCAQTYLETTYHQTADFELEDYRGVGYGQVQPEVSQAIRNAASTEGIFLDPVFTGKAFWGLTDLIAQRKIKKGAQVIFLHSGGHPTLFVQKSAAE